MVSYGGHTTHSHSHHRGFKPVAGVLVISPYPKLTAHAVGTGCTCLVEPVLAAYVIGYKFVGEKSRGKERKARTPRCGVAERQSSEICLETVLLLTVEIYLEFLGVHGCAKRGLAVDRSELIVVDGHIAKKRHVPAVGKTEVELSLIHI